MGWEALLEAQVILSAFLVEMDCVLYKMLIRISIELTIVKVRRKMTQEEQLANMRSLACTLHGVYFGAFHALKGEKEFFEVYGIAIESVNDTVGNYFRQLEKKEVDTIISDLERTGLYQGLELQRKGDKYIFTIRKCLFAGGEAGVHASIKGIDLPCPIALAIGAAFSRQNPEKKVFIYPSVYEPEGTVTQIDLTTPEDYRKRLVALRKMSKGKK